MSELQVVRNLQFVVWSAQPSSCSRASPRKKSRKGRRDLKALSFLTTPLEIVSLTRRLPSATVSSLAWRTRKDNKQFFAEGQDEMWPHRINRDCRRRPKSKTDRELLCWIECGSKFTGGNLLVQRLKTGILRFLQQLTSNAERKTAYSSQAIKPVVVVNSRNNNGHIGNL